MIKSQANIATRHDILVYFFQANVVGNVATSSPMANYGEVCFLEISAILDSHTIPTS